MFTHPPRTFAFEILALVLVLVSAYVGCNRTPPNPNAPIEPGEYEVRFETDDLSSIAQRAYGDMELWYCLLNANPELSKRPGFNVDMGETLTIPRKEDLDSNLPKSIFPKELPADYIIMPGDSLYFIAQGCYGDREQWDVLYKANRTKLSARVKEDKRQIIAGEVLHIPALPYVEDSLQEE